VLVHAGVVLRCNMHRVATRSTAEAVDRRPALYRRQVTPDRPGSRALMGGRVDRARIVHPREKSVDAGGVKM